MWPRGWIPVVPAILRQPEWNSTHVAAVGNLDLACEVPDVPLESDLIDVPISGKLESADVAAGRLAFDILAAVAEHQNWFRPG